MTQLITAIPVYNGERFLPLTLDCLARQTRRPDRVVVFDNGSTDRTPEIVRKFPGLKCEFQRNEANLGVLGNANRCLSLSSQTQYLHLLMADDLVKPEFCRRMISALGQINGRGLAYCFNENISETGEIIGRRQPWATGLDRSVSLNNFLGPQAELASVLLPGVILKTDYQPPVCLFRDMPQVADGLFLAEWAALTGRVCEIGDYLCQYRLHPYSASARHMYDLQSFVKDEWLLAETILSWIREPMLARILRRSKLQALLGARMQVKIDMMNKLRPQFAAEISRFRRTSVGLWGSALGWLAVRGRDAFRRLRGQPTKLEEVFSTAVTTR